MCEITEEMDWIVSKGKSLKVELSETMEMRNEILECYGESFKEMKRLKARLHDMCVHKDDRKIVSFGIPNSVEFRDIYCLSRLLKPARDQLSTLNAGIREIQIDLKRLRSQWSELNEDRKNQI